MAPTERTPKRQKLSPPGIPSALSTSERSPSVSGQQDDASTASQTPDRSSWYSRTWPRKAAPITQVARESISSASNSVAETASIITDKVSDASKSSRKSSLALTRGKSATNKALPVTATTTTDHAMPDNKRAAKQETSETPSIKTPASLTTTADPGKEPIPESVPDPQPVQASEVSGQGGTPAPDTSKSADNKAEIITPRSWIGWLARTEDGSVKSSNSVQSTLR